MKKRKSQFHCCEELYSSIIEIAKMESSSRKSTAFICSIREDNEKIQSMKYFILKLVLTYLLDVCCARVCIILV